MSVLIPHSFTMPTLGSLPSNSYRVRKRIHWATNRDKMRANETRRININAPPNWYMLGSHTKVCFRLRGEGTQATATAPSGTTPGVNPDANPNDKIRVRWGAGAPWQKVQETLNAGSFCVDSLDERDAVQPILAYRGWCSRRAHEPEYNNVEIYSNITVAGPGTTPLPAGTYGAFVVDTSNSSGAHAIGTLQPSGYASRRDRALVLATTPFADSQAGYSYSVPLGAYSRIGNKEFIPVGLMGSFSTESWYLSFTMDSNANIFAVPPTANVDDADICDLRIDATYLEVLDPDVQGAIEKLYKKEAPMDVDGRSLPMRLEMPIISLATTSYLLPNNSTSTILRIPSNRPSVRGLLLSVADTKNGAAADGDLSACAFRWVKIQVKVGGNCIQECPYEGNNASCYPTLISDLAHEYEMASHLFSVYPPEREALEGTHPMGKMGYTFDTTNRPNFIAMSFENSPHFNLSEPELASARGVDMRNVGELELHLQYTTSASNPGVNAPLTSEQKVFVTLAYDQVLSIDRSGVHDVSESVL